MNRRTFLLSSACAALASLIPFRPRKLVLYGDGVHDDSEALTEWFKGNYQNVVRPDGSPVGKILHNGVYAVSGAMIPRALGLATPFGEGASYQQFCYNYIKPLGCEEWTEFDVEDFV